MFTLLSNIILGYRICSKHGVKFRPWRRVKYSNASFLVERKEDRVDYTIWCSASNLMFIPSLFHELAHCKDYKLTGFSKRYLLMELNFITKGRVQESVEDYSARLLSEVRANKYAIRYMKSCSMYSDNYQKDLEWAMTTYITHISNKYIADYHYQIMKVLRGELHEKRVHINTRWQSS